MRPSSSDRLLSWNLPGLGRRSPARAAAPPLPERRAALLLTDVVGLSAAWAVGSALTGSAAGPPLGWLGVTLGLLVAADAYRGEAVPPAVLRCALGLGAGLSGVGLAAVGAPLDHGTTLAAATVVAFMGLPVLRHRVHQAGVAAARPVLLVGRPSACEAARRAIAGVPFAGFVVETEVSDLTGLGPAAEAALAQQRYEWVVVDGAAVPEAGWRPLVPIDAPVVDVPTLCAHLAGGVPVAAIDDRWLLTQLAWHRGWGYHAGKRTLDAVVGTLGLVALAPVVLGAAWHSRRHTGAPWRKVALVGQSGRPFSVVRPPLVGHLARWTELGRVVSGQMSLVGPNPDAADALARMHPLYLRRHLAKPGLISWMQVCSPFSPLPATETERLAYDLYYLQHRSLTLDAEILLRAAGLLLFHLCGLTRPAPREAA